MTRVKVKCEYCRKKFLKELRRVNESNKKNWKHYCSLKCQSKLKNKQKFLKCDNPNCNKTFKRQLHEISSSKNHFCSKLCSAIVNNPKSAKKRLKIRICPTCEKKFTGPRKYCLSECWPKPNRITQEQVIKIIKRFYKENGRIPLKRECKHYNTARRNFGTWNKAIKSAGFEPNPVMFAKKFIANDGHKCDSLAEKIVDDWLFRRKIKHKINIPYPGSTTNPPLTADFVIENLWIEFFGLKGEHLKYDLLRKKKLKLVMAYNLNLIEICPQDLFPRNKLSEILYCLDPDF